MNDINQMAMQGIMNQMGGPQNFQKAMNQAQQQLQKSGYTMEQFMQNPQMVLEKTVPQDRLQQAMQAANNFYGRR